MTLSIAATCLRTGAVAAAATSSSMAVGARCAFAVGGVGAALSQNVSDPRLGPRLLDHVAGGADAPDALGRVLDEEPFGSHRQLAVVDRRGGVAHHTGDRALAQAAAYEAPGVVAIGNLLPGPEVVEAMLDAFLAEPEVDLVSRLLKALQAGLGAGGEIGPVHSAGLVAAVDVCSSPATDLRVDWSDEDPVDDLVTLWDRWEPQWQDYVGRALDPAESPSFGVPGDN